MFKSCCTGWRRGLGYLESYQLPQTPNWITMFHTYDSYQLSPQDIEIRPTWFHIANHVFFNTPIQRLPIFFSLFTEEGNVERIRFLDDNLSDRARNYIGEALLDMPIHLKQLVKINALKREGQEMVWWLWHNVGHKDEKRTLS